MGSGSPPAVQVQVASASLGCGTRWRTSLTTIAVCLANFSCAATPPSEPGIDDGADGTGSETPTPAITTASDTTTGGDVGGTPGTTMASGGASVVPVGAGTTDVTTEPTSTDSTSTTAGTTEPPVLGPDGLAATCDKQTEVASAASQRATIGVSFELDGQPLQFGEPNALAQGGTVIPINLRLYLSHFAFYRGEERFDATPVDAQGAALPYGVKFVNAEDMASLQVQLLTMPGEYDSLSFVWGLSHACNATLLPLDPPLDEASQLKWPHSLGYLFLRFEGIADEQAGSNVPGAIHMGAADGPTGFAPEIRLPLPAAGETASLALKIALDGIFDGASADIDLSDYVPLPPAPPSIDEEILAGEKVRRTATSLGIFTLNSSP